VTSPAVGYRRRDTRKRLEEAGFDAAQARVLIDVMTGTEERLARKDDVAVVKADVAEVKVTLTTLEGRMDGLVIAMEGLRQEMMAKFDALEARLSGRIDTVHAELKGQLLAIKWLLGFVLASAVPMALALVRLAFLS